MRTLSKLFAVALGASFALAAPLALATEHHTVIVRTPATTNEAQQLIVQATELETTAGANEASAASMEQQAEKFSARARTLRALAVQIADPGRAELNIKAAGIESEATSSRSRATEMRRHAKDLRSTAQELRAIAREMTEGRVEAAHTAS